MPSFIPPLDGSPPPGAHTPTTAIRRWTRELLGLTDDTAVWVSEMDCGDPGCPILHTLITVVETEQTRQWQMTRPKPLATKQQVELALREPPTATSV
ncbi:MAG: hypothetical protein EXS41_05430 [Opitutaceae bacterium]|nr:hypothetical protein [Opitutaceae bacterium]